MRRSRLVTFVIVLAGLWVLGPQASSHREAPLIASDPLADNTDVYAFVDPNEPGLVTLGLLGGDTAGFPNGRRVGDDVVDIALRVMAGATAFTPMYDVFPNNALGDGVDANDVPYLDVFPYLASPHPGLDAAGPVIR
jgi:hypothetical protein